MTIYFIAPVSIELGLFGPDPLYRISLHELSIETIRQLTILLDVPISIDLDNVYKWGSRVGSVEIECEPVGERFSWCLEFIYLLVKVPPRITQGTEDMINQIVRDILLGCSDIFPSLRAEIELSPYSAPVVEIFSAWVKEVTLDSHGGDY